VFLVQAVVDDIHQSITVDVTRLIMSLDRKGVCRIYPACVYVCARFILSHFR